MNGDLLTTLPINKERIANPSELELINNIFQTAGENPNIINKTKLALMAGLLYLLLSIPFIPNFVTTFTRNNVISHIVLFLLFSAAYFGILYYYN